MNKKFLSLFLILTSALYSMVLWGFAIREHMAPGIHSLYPLTIIFVFVVQNIVAIRLIENYRFMKRSQPFGVLLFFVLNIYFLFSISSVKRENEIRNYFSRNEYALTNIVDHFDSFGDDTRMQELKKDMKLERVFRRAEHVWRANKESVNMINMRLYTCVGYGYGVIYSCDPEINQPENLGGSLVKNWLKLKDHWFYYSIFD